MSTLSLIDSDAFAQIEKVADLHIQGKSPHMIAKELGMTRVEARQAIETWQEMIKQDTESKDVAREYLNKLVAHYDRLIDESYKNLRNLKSMSFDEKVSAQINATLRNIADYEAKRVDALQKAGLLDANDLGDELAEREQNEAILVDILRNHLCVDCRQEVAYRLGQVTGRVEAVNVEVVDD